MRLRTLLTLTAGAALGAGTMYLTDPEHGSDRRRVARKEAFAQARRGAARAATDGPRHAAGLLDAVVTGYQQARVQDPGPATVRGAAGR